MLIRDLLRRYPDVALVLRKHQVDPAYTYLSLELAAQASGQDVRRVLADVRAAVRPHAC
jgi:hypothetical protein